MTTKTNKPSRLRTEILALAHDMHSNGTMGEAAYRKMRDLGKAEAATLTPCAKILFASRLVRTHK